MLNCVISVISITFYFFFGSRLALIVNKLDMNGFVVAAGGYF